MPRESGDLGGEPGGLNVAEALLLVALHDDEGTVSWGVTDGLDYGLAGGLLIDLVLAGRLAVAGGKVTVADPTPVGNEVADEALARVAAAGRERDAKHWVQNFHGLKRLRGRLQEGLVRAGILRHEAGRFLWVFPHDRFPEAAGAPEDEVRRRLRGVLLDGEPPDERTAVLAGLVRACDLIGEVVPGEQKGAAERRAEEVATGDSVSAGVRDAISEATMAVTLAIVVGAGTALAGGSAGSSGSS